MKIKDTEFFHGRKTKPFPIFSIHNKGMYFATGSYNGELKIYNNASVRTYIDHSGSVLCVRFDDQGDFLATSSDDWSINIYKRDILNDFFTLFKKVKNHTSDVVQIVWFKKYLISCSYDGYLNIYEKSTFNLVRGIKAFDRCQGVSVDPQNEYLACHGSEELKIYNSNFEEVSCITDPFQKKIHEAFFSRNSWSPDGQFLATCLASNGKNNSVEILKRKTFNSEFSLVGHVAPSEVVSFHSSLFEINNQKHFIVAVSSQDKSISFWHSKNHKPFLLVKDIFVCPIMDMFWCEDILYACSFDGTVKKIEFENGELGKKADLIDPFIEKIPTIPFTLENIEIKEKGITSLLDLSKEDEKKSDSTIIDSMENNADVLLNEQDFSSIESLSIDKNKSFELDTKNLDNIKYGPENCITSNEIFEFQKNIAIHEKDNVPSSNNSLDRNKKSKHTEGDSVKFQENKGKNIKNKIFECTESALIDNAKVTDEKTIRFQNLKNKPIDINEKIKQRLDRVMEDLNTLEDSSTQNNNIGKTNESKFEKLHIFQNIKEVEDKKSIRAESNNYKKENGNFKESKSDTDKNEIQKNEAFDEKNLNNMEITPQKSNNMENKDQDVDENKEKTLLELKNNSTNDYSENKEKEIKEVNNKLVEDRDEKINELKNMAENEPKKYKLNDNVGDTSFPPKKKKKIAPVLIAPLKENNNIFTDTNRKLFALFKCIPSAKKILDRKNLESEQEFTINEFKIKIENGERCKVCVFRGNKHFYTLFFKKIFLFCGNKNYICFVIKDKNTDSIIIHDLETGVIAIPAIVLHNIAMIDVLNHDFLVLNGNGKFQVINIKRRKEITNGTLEIDDKLINIKLDRKYFMLAHFEHRTLFYDRNLKSWLKLEHTFDSTILKKNLIDDDFVCFEDSDCEDQTIDELEYKFRIKEFTNNIQGMVKIAKTMVKFAVKMSEFSEILFNKYVHVFKILCEREQKRFVYKMMEEMNSNCLLQPFVIEIMESLNGINSSK